MIQNPQLPLFPESITNKYKILQEMGRGAFSTVYKIQSKIDNNIYCLKKLNLKKTTNKTNEITILSKLSHPNLVKYITSFQDKEGIYIIMEYCEYGDLYTLLHSVRKKKIYINEDIIWDISFQCLLALEYLHNKNIIHRDIKLLNIFMSKDKIIKIGDMGMSKLLSNKEMKMSRVGTPLYLAPELVKKEKYDYKADIWSLGCSLYHLSKTIPPFNDENLIKLGEAIVKEQPLPLPDCYSDKLCQFIMKLLTKDKNKRPSASEAIDLIPDRIKIKYNNKNHINYNNLRNNNNNIVNEKHHKKKKISEDNKLESTDNSSLNNTKNNSNLQKKENVISAGKTFYKFFRNFPEKKRILQSRRGNKIISNNNIEDKFVNINNTNNNRLNNNKTQFNFFDSKLFSSNYISKSMNNTQEGFFKRKESAKNNQNFISNNDIFIRDKFSDSKPLNLFFNSENDEMKEDINSNVLRINHENLKSKRLNSSHVKKEENKNELNLNKINYKTEYINNKPIIKSEDFRINNLGVFDNKNNVNLVFPMIQNNNIVPKNNNIHSKIAKFNKNKMIVKTENSGFNFFRKTFNLIPNKILTIHDLK